MRLRTVLVVGLVSATVLVNPLPAEPAAPNPYSVKLGMAQGPNQRALSQAAFAGARDVGATWTRLSISWEDIEQTRGVFTWQASDQQVANARASGLAVLGTISYTPDFAHHPDCPDHPCAPAASMYDDFARFSAKVAARYKGKVDAWEIWNEPNETRFWQPKPEPAGYARLLDLTYAAIKQVNIDAKVILGGLSTHCTNSADFLTWRTFMDEFYRAGGARFDAFAIHPYYPGNRPMHPATCNAFYNLPKTKTYLTAHGDGHANIWITEFGYKTIAITPKEQGERLREALGQVVNWSWAERLFVFAWMDFRRVGFDHVYAFGLNDRFGNPKESRWILRSYVRSGGK
jgi:arabinogalactan endo-1,4-beta-galactosidase